MTNGIFKNAVFGDKFYYCPEINIDLKKAFASLDPKIKQDFLSEVLLSNFGYTERIDVIKDISEESLGEYGLIKLIIKLFDTALSIDSKEDVKKMVDSRLNNVKQEN